MIRFFDTKLVFYTLHFKIVSTADTALDGWLGAILRNRFLHSAHQVTNSENISLKELFYKIPLPTDHPLYDELSEGFPPPFFLFVESYGSYNEIKQDEILSFSMVLVGSAVASNLQLIIDAVRQMCEEGFGMDPKRFTFLDVHERSIGKKSRLMATGQANICQELHSGLYPYEFIHHTSSENCITVATESPLCLIKQKKKTSDSIGYQDKCNGFPSFYQLVRSCANRLALLSILYGNLDDTCNAKELNETIDKYVADAALPVLEAANVKRVNLLGTQRKEKESRIPLRGYVGELIFRGNYQPYLPLLLCMQYLGVGHYLTYGFGKYKIV